MSSSSSTMDSSGFSQVGRYGTICLMKRQEPGVVVTSFGIDTEELTFGRDPTCGVRLYYPDVSLIHCRIVFEERKAFLIVLGANGLVVDGCKVYPNGSPSNSGSPTIIPLTNNSEFEIHGKRFRFTYPPKELRAALFATPARPPQRKLRLSMIHSAQVFSPRPSKDPRENLRILKSPLKNAFKAPPTPTRTRVNIFSAAHTREDTDEEVEEADDIVLVDGNHPRVVEDEKDLVILEDVQLPDPRALSVPVQQYQSPQQLQPPQTPVRKRSLSRNTLHRAVLIRSAQRAVLQAEHAEREREEEEEEEMEVLETVASDAASESEEDAAEDDEEGVSDANEEDDDSGTDEDAEEYEEEIRGREDERDPSAQKSTWRKSLERIWPFRSSSAPVEEEEEQDDASSSSNSDDDNDIPSQSADEEEEHENRGHPAPLPAAPQAATPVRRALGSFMTPQAHPRIFARPEPQEDTEAAGSGGGGGGAGRYSLGGGEARRVIQTEQVWKVRDIVVPPAASSGSRAGPGSAFIGPGTPGRGAGAGAGPMASPVRARQVVGEEERKAIQERRRSALREADTFFGGGVPGMGAGTSPGKGQGWSPAKTATSSSSSSITGTSSSGASPFKAALPAKLKRHDDDDDEDDVAEEMDTRSLLERMKETVEGMKKRRSLAPGTPVRAPMTPARAPGVGFARPGTVSPSKGMGPTMMDVAEEEEEEDKENVVGAEGKTDGGNDGGRMEEEVFSLLRPGVLEEARAREEESIAEVEEELLRDGVQAGPGEADEDVEMADEEPETHPDAFAMPVAVELPVEVDATPPVDRISSGDEGVADVPVPKKNGRARLLRAKKSAPTPEESVDEEPADQPEPKSRSKPPSRKATTPSTKPIAAEMEDNNSEDGHIPDAPTEPPKTATRRGRKAAVETADNVEAAPLPARRARKAATAEPEEIAVAPTTKRKRKATAEPEDPSPKDEPTIPAPVRRGRKPATPAIVPTEIIEEEIITPPPAPLKRSVRKTAAAAAETEGADEARAPIRRGRTPRTAPSALPVRKAAPKKPVNETAGTASGSGGVKQGTRGKPIDVEMVDDGGNDPLDSLDAEEAEAVVAKPKGRKKAVKVEVVEDPDKIPVPTTRGAKAKTPAAKTPAAKPRAKKAPATAPAAVQDVDKENTPGSEESIVDVDEPVKIRVSRTTRKGVAATRNTKVKQEDVEHSEGAAPEPEVARGRSVRAARTRTRT